METKIYTDDTGKFQMNIPLDWEYKDASLNRKIIEGRPRAFGMHDGYVGAFQISCKPVNKHIEDF
ncbi:MAG: hypothetical protein JWN78_2476 [Bacteroidota bacterium]|nr:hypothetical protein [Bacteroidota bacterium]